MARIERLRKPEPARMEPVRDWRVLQQRVPGAPSPPPAAPSAAGAAPEAVGLGYRVIEEYLQRGRSAAAILGLGARPGPPAAGSFQTLSSQLIRDGMLWLEQLVRIATPSEAGKPPPSGVAGEARQTPSLRLRLDARAPVEVDLRLTVDLSGRSLAVHDMRAPDEGARPIPGATLSLEDGLVLGLRVPPGQPPGSYTAIVYDRADGAVCGTLAVTVGPAPGPT